MKKLSMLVFALVLCVTFCVATNATAVTIRVSQESAAGTGDFDANVLGTIEAYSTPLSTAAFYQYGTPNWASYNGELNGGPAPISSLSQVFLVDALDGLSLVVVHDNPNDGSGGRTHTKWTLTGDTAAEVLADDPGETVTVSGGGTMFESRKSWGACCTDGYAIGSLDGNWAMYGEFVNMPRGISDWAAVSSNGHTLTPLALEAGRRVRLDLAAVPEPSTIFMMVTGLVGLSGLGRRKF